MLVEVKNLKFTYPEAKNPAIEIKTLTVESGEKVLLLGPSGSGKSTLLDLLSGVLASDQGTIAILGEELSKKSMRDRDQFRAKNIGVIFQQFNLIPYLNVSENINLPGLFNNSLNIEWKPWAERLGLNTLLNQPVSKLSVGQQQRVAVVRALVNQPKLIIADEPTSALDSDARESFLKLLFELAESNGSAILFVTHDQSLAKYFDRVIRLNEINKAQI